MSVIGDVRTFIAGCPFLNEFSQGIGKLINVNYLDEGKKSYMVEPSVNDRPIKKRYMDGSTVRQLNFIFASREYFGRELAENLDIDEFYEKFSEWLEECSMEKKLPILGEGKEARKIEATTHGYVFDASETLAQYQIQCKLTYFQERK